MSNQTLVNDALSLINVLPSAQDASAEDGALALRAVDELAEEWAEDGIEVTWSPAARLSDDCPLEGVEKTAVQYHLAIRLCPHFGRDPSATLVALASASYNKLARAVVSRGLNSISVPMPAAESPSTGYDIIRDE